MRLLSFSLLAILLLSSFSVENRAEGIAWYERRAEGASGLHARPDYIFKALDLFQKQYDRGEEREISGLYLMRCHNYIARFVETDIEKKRERFEKTKLLGEYLVRVYPSSAAIRFEYITGMGFWGESNGIMKCAKDGLLAKMKGHTEELIKTDSMFNNAAGFKILGLLNIKAPYIPFMLTWPNDKTGLKLVEKSLRHFPKDHGNNFYYGETLLEIGQKERAKLYFNAVLNLPCRKELMLEDRAFQEDARKILAKLNN